MPVESGPRRLSAPLVMLAVAGLLLHAREILGGRLVWRDIEFCHAPVKYFIAQTLRHGELPQWWPWDAAGTPLLAQPQFSVFHPVTLLFLLLPFWTAYAAQNLLVTWLGLGGAYVLARCLRLSPWSAAMAAVLYGLNGYFVSVTEYPYIQLAAATLPWYCASLLVAVRRGGAWRLVPGLAMGLLLLAGDPLLSITGAATGLLVLFADTDGRPLTKVALAVVSPIVGIGLACIQLMPAMSLLGESDRAVAMKDANKWALELHHLWGTVVPIGHGPTDFVLSTFVGPAGLALGFASFSMIRRDRRVAVLWILAVLSVWLALGDDYGLNAIARHVVPIWAKLRYPMKSIVPAYLAVSLLAGLSADALADATQRSSVLRWAVPMALVMAALITVKRPAVDASLLATLAVTLVAVLAASRSLSIITLATQALAAAIVIHPVVQPDFYRESDLIRLLRDRHVGLEGPAMDVFDWSKRPSDEDLAMMPAVGGGHRSSYGGFTGMPALTAFSPATSPRMRVIEDIAWNDVRAGLLGAKYLVLREPVPQSLEHRIIARVPGLELALVDLPRSLPRAYGVRRAKLATSISDAVRLIEGPDFKPGREIVVDGAGQAEWTTRPDALAVAAPIRSRTNDSVTIESTLPWPGFVVLNEAYYAGWSATVDGVPTPILPANVAVRAVEVPQGPHRIVFRYLTPGLKTGAVVSLCSWLAWAVAGLVLMGRSRRKGLAQG